MSIYDANRISHNLVRHHVEGVTVGFREFKVVTWQEILALEPIYWWDTVKVYGHQVVYAHFVYRVLAVHGIQLGAGSRPSQRHKALQLLISQQQG